ncbi:hypothetical protein EB796_022678 [Bugula neritina]|uniref:Uncharacterized protein n=1 Tax=Bugula neritina TaxID=10212 RepID=A0A7J7IYL2_BUGNE|nr:hypothetical protein EB796_022678 [Bugula neritina]
MVTIASEKIVTTAFKMQVGVNGHLQQVVVVAQRCVVLAIKLMLERLYWQHNDTNSEYDLTCSATTEYKLISATNCVRTKFCGGRYRLDYLTQFSNALSTSTPGGTATGATAIQIVPATDPVRAGPLTAAYLDGSSSITFPSGNEYLDLQLFGTISILFQSNQASQTAVVVGYNGGSGLGFTLNSGSLVFTYPCTGADITESVAVPNNEWVFAAATYSATTSGPTGESGANVEVFVARQDGSVLLTQTYTSTCTATIAGQLVAGNGLVGYLSCLGVEEEAVDYDGLVQKRAVCMGNWKMMFKASSLVPTVDDRSWDDLWIDGSFVNDDDSAALLTQPTSVYKSADANTWDDNSNFNQMALGLFDRLGGILGFIIFDTSHMTGMTSKARRETFMAPNRIIVASPWMTSTQIHSRHQLIQL